MNHSTAILNITVYALLILAPIGIALLAIYGVVSFIISLLQGLV